MAGDVDFFAGWGDHLTDIGGVNPVTGLLYDILGIPRSSTTIVRKIIGVDDQVDRGSPGYRWGGLVGAVHTMALMGLGEGARPPVVEPPAAKPPVSNSAPYTGPFENHHIIPKAISRRLGYKYPRANEVVALPKDVHRAMHSGRGYTRPGGHYNNRWWEKFEENGGLDEDEVDKFMDEMAYEFGW